MQKNSGANTAIA